MPPQDEHQERGLLPCPFCGNANIAVHPDEHGSGGQHVPPYHASCAITKGGCGVTQIGEEEDEAVAAWNRRAALAVRHQEQPVAFRFERYGLPECATEMEWKTVYSQCEPRPSDQNVRNVVPLFTHPAPPERHQEQPAVNDAALVFLGEARDQLRVMADRANSLLSECVTHPAQPAVRPQEQPALYAHELLTNGGGVWIGCEDLDVLRKSHTPGETGEEILVLFTHPAQASTEQCWCDKQGIGEPGVSCGDCPTRDYKQASTSQDDASEPVAWVTAIEWKPRQSEQVIKVTANRQAEYGFSTPIYASPQPAQPSQDARIEELERDAARYRWLREQSHPWGRGVWFSLDVLDRNIDAALAKKGTP